MKSIYMFLVAVLMVLSFSVAGFAHGTSSGAQTSGTGQTYGSSESQRYAANETHSYMSGGSQMGTEHNMLTYSGKVVSVNDTDHTLVVSGNDGEKTFDLSRVTTTGTLEPGHDVQVTYYTDMNGRMVASSVTSGGRLSSLYGEEYGMYDEGMGTSFDARS